MSSLHGSALVGNLDAIKSLLENKANVDEPDGNGDTALIAVARAAGSNPSMKSIMMMEYLVKTARANSLSRSPSSGETVSEILSKNLQNRDDPLMSNLFALLGRNCSSPTKETPTTSPRRVERSEELKKLLNMHIPDAKKPVPYREASSRPQTPPPTAEVLKLRAENEVLRKEVDRLRDIVNKMNPQEQLKTMYARLVQLEAIESELNNLKL